MSKKLLVMGAAFAMGTCAPQLTEAWTGFYVGIQGGLDLKQIKIYDGTKHTPGSTTHTVKADTYYTYDADKGLQAITTKETKGTLSCKSSALAGSDDYAATPWVYLLRPSAYLMAGYNYRISSLFIVGVEARAGVTFGAHKYDGFTKTGPASMYGTKGDIPSDTNKDATSYTTKTYSEKEDSYYADANKFSTQVEVKTNFSADASLRLGFVIPGDRFAVFLKGGIGVDRQEIKFNRTGFGPWIYEAALQAAQADAKVAFMNSKIAMRSAEKNDYGSKNIKADSANNVVLFGNIRDSLYFGFAPDRVLYTSYVDSSNLASITKDDNLYKDMAYVLADNLASAEHGLSEQALAKAKSLDPSLSESKSVFTCHVGVDFEYKVAKNLLLRLFYEWKWNKGFWIDQTSSVMRGQTSSDMDKWMDSDEAKDVLNRYVAGALSDDGKPIFTTDQEKTAAFNGVLGKLKGYFASFPAEGSSLGTVDHRVKVKNCSHTFGVAIAYKF